MAAITTLTAGVYLFKVYNENTRTRCEIDVVLVSLFLTSTYLTYYFSVSIVDFEQVNDSWVVFSLLALNK